MGNIRLRALVRVAVASGFAAACGVSGQQAAEPASTPMPPPPLPPASPAVVCLAAVHDSVRMYRLHHAVGSDGRAREWRLTMTEPASKAPPLELTLPGATPAVMGANARLSYRSGAGGVVVALDTSPDGASLEIDVNYELEVKVDARLTPAIGGLDTDGPVRLPPCRIEPP